MKSMGLLMLGVFLLSLGSGMLVYTLAIKTVSDIGIETPDGSIIPLHSLFSGKRVKFRNIIVKGYVEVAGCSTPPDLTFYYKLKVNGVSISDWSPINDVTLNGSIKCGARTNYRFKISSDRFAGKLYDLNTSVLPVEVWVLVIEKGKNPNDYEQLAVKAGSFGVLDMAIYLKDAEMMYTEYLKQLRASGSKEAALELVNDYFNKYAGIYAGGNQTLLSAYYAARKGIVTPNICWKTNVSEPKYGEGGKKEVIACRGEDLPYVIIDPSAGPFELPIYGYTSYNVADLPEDIRKLVEQAAPGATQVATRTNYLYTVDTEKAKKYAKDNGYVITEKRTSAGQNCVTFGKMVYDSPECAKNPSLPNCKSGYKTVKTVCDQYSPTPLGSWEWGAEKKIVTVEGRYGQGPIYAITSASVMSLTHGIESPNSLPYILIYSVAIAAGAYLVVVSRRR